MSVRVSGAGSAEVNGEYVPDGTFGPKQLPRFRLLLPTGQKGDIWIRHWESTGPSPLVLEQCSHSTLLHARCAPCSLRSHRFRCVRVCARARHSVPCENSCFAWGAESWAITNNAYTTRKQCVNSHTTSLCPHPSHHLTPTVHCMQGGGRTPRCSSLQPPICTRVSREVFAGERAVSWLHEAVR